MIPIDVWRRRVEEELGDESLSSLERTTPGGFGTRPLYAEPSDTRPSEVGEDEESASGAGSVSLCPVVDAPDPVLAARDLSDDADGGAAGTWLRLDRSARLGGGDLVGDGVPAAHGTDLAQLFSQVDLGAAPGRELWLDAGGNSLPWAALWLAWCERSGVDPANVAVHFGCDPLAALSIDGSLPRDLMKLSSEMAALVRFTERHLPGSTAVTVSTAVYQEAGADLEQELGFMVATLLEYLRGLGDSGLDAESASRAIDVRFAVGTRVFPEVAKLRAARLLWRAALAVVGVDRSREPRIHVVGSRRSMAAREPELNLLRASEQGMIAYCGGASAMSLWGFDRAYGMSALLARRLARNTALILKHEAGVARVQDPAAGSYAVEAMTRQLAEQGWALAQQIERDGGMRRMVLSGRLAEVVAESAAGRRAAFADGAAGITGVTDYVDSSREGKAPVSIDLEGLKAAAEERRARHAEWQPQESNAAALTRDFVVEDLLSMARQGATLWELGARLGGDEGAERAKPLLLARDAAPFESPSDSASRGEEE